MSSTQLFDLANLYILPFWTMMILFPKWNVTKKVMGSYLPFLPLIGAYIYYLIITTAGNPESAAALANPQLTDIARFFGEKNAAGAGWVHFLVMDLFIGRWIYQQEKQIWTIHSLILCLFFGPVGLLSHIITDTIFSKTDIAEVQSDATV